MSEEVDQHHLQESGLESVESEEVDLDASPPRYEIVTFPADYTLEGLVAKHKKSQIKVPGFQRKFVWTLPQASKLIESFLLGLPVPAIFLYTDPVDNTLQVIDGQQRLLSIVYFFDGYFGPEERGKRTVFALKGLNERSPYLNKTYAQLVETDEAAANQLNDSVLRAFVVKQLNPGDGTSIYHVFERLNTGGTQLVSQEIRNCVYHGPFNDLICDLNSNSNWRKLFGKAAPDKRQRDVELILRFLALRSSAAEYEKPMKDFLSNFMGAHRGDSPDVLDQFKTVFESAATAVVVHLGEKPFHIRAGLNAAVCDSVLTAFSKNLNRIPPDIRERFDTLVKDDAFLRSVSSGTTDNEVVHSRLDAAEERLFGV
jgi:hypothetical protein